MALDLGLEEKDGRTEKEVEDLGGSRKGREMGGARGGAKGTKPSLGEVPTVGAASPRLRAGFAFPWWHPGQTPSSTLITPH